MVSNDNKSLLLRKTFGTPFENKRIKSLFPKIEDRPESRGSTKESPLKVIPALNAFQRAKKKIQYWIRYKSFSVDDAFREIAALAIGPNVTQEKSLRFDEFKKGLSKVIGLNLDKDEVNFIFCIRF